MVVRKTLPAALLWALRRNSRRLVFDFDDAIFCNTDGTPSQTRMSRFAAMAASSDKIVAGNAFLADVARRFNPRVTVIPTAVDLSRYTATPVKPQNHFDAVWIGSSSTRKYLEDIIPALRRARDSIPNLRLKIVADFDLDAPGLVTLPVPWSAETEAAALASSHVGIAPMPDNDWTRGKCALKVLQYMAAGLPVVSSPAGVNGEAVEPGYSGFLVEGEAAWADALRTLAANPEFAAVLGQNGRTRVGLAYSREVAAEALLASFGSLLLS